VKRVATSLSVVLAVACGGAPSTSDAPIVDVAVPSARAADSAPPPVPTPPRRAALPPAPPPPPPERPSSGEDVAVARSLFRQGTDAYARGDFAGARSFFSAAYDRVPKAQVLVNIAACDIKLGHVSSGCALLEQFWREGSRSQRPAILGQWGSTCPSLASLP
jgi:hypothetical protein